MGRRILLSLSLVFILAGCSDDPQIRFVRSASSVAASTAPANPVPTSPVSLPPATTEKSPAPAANDEGSDEFPADQAEAVSEFFTKNADKLPGHSKHGSSFDQGPRLQGKIIPNFSRVEFKADTCKPETQDYFNQGMTQIHVFAMLEAERSFRTAAKIDPECALAYFGMAAANYIFSAGSFARASKLVHIAKNLSDKSSERERGYINAFAARFEQNTKSKHERRLNMVKGFQELHKKYPDDLEATALFVELAWDERMISEIGSSANEMDAEILRVLEKNPEHPITHYRIHLWDTPDLSSPEAKAAVQHSRELTFAVPSVPHAWHMPAHLFANSEMDLAFAQHTEGSHRLDNTTLFSPSTQTPHQVPTAPYEIHNYGHHLDYAVLGAINSLQSTKAIEMALDAIRIPRHPRYNRFALHGQRGIAGTGVDLYLTLLALELWSEAEKLQMAGWLPDEGSYDQKVLRLITLVEVALSKNSADKVQDLLKDFEALLKRIENDAEMTSDFKTAFKAALRYTQFLVISKTEKLSEIEMTELMKIDSLMLFFKTRLAIENGHFKIAESAIEDALKFGVPAQMLPNILRVQLIEAKIALKKFDEALSLANEFTHKFLLLADPTCPVLSRLNSLLVKGKMGRGPIQTKPEEFAQIGTHNITGQGPLGWSPVEVKAPADLYVDLRNTLLVLHLGKACALCDSQLRKLTERVKSKPWESRWINNMKLVIVSPDSEIVTGPSGDRALPIQTISDPALKFFKAFSAYDDFEDQPLHGLYYIDDQSRLRWWDISYQAFQNDEDLDFLFREIERLRILPESRF